MRSAWVIILAGLLMAGGCQTQSARPQTAAFGGPGGIWGNFRPVAGTMGGYHFTTPQFSVSAASGTVYQPEIGDYRAPSLNGYSPSEGNWSAPDVPDLRAFDDNFHIPVFNYKKVKPPTNSFFTPPKPK